MSLRAGIDVGGTFTDITIMDESSGVIKEVKKVPSNPQQPLAVLEKVLADLEQAWGSSSISYVLHGSTHALNALLEEKGGVTGVLMTRGFRDVYEIGRQWRGDAVFNILYPGPKRFVPRRLIAEVDERMDCEGRVVAPLDTGSLNRALDVLESQGIDALAIVFLFSYVNDAHERKAGELARKRLPHLFVSLSSEVNPMWREYERTCTTVLNAYLGPQMVRHFSQLEKTVRGHFPSAHSLVMKSNGGVGAPSYVAKYPIHTLMSGPVAGVVASHRLGAAKRIEHLISLDVGGTSSDMALIPGEPLFRSEWKIGRHPARADSVEIESLGAGGGSIARARFGRVIQVGPQSAGAVPGPACYRRGGREPTVTDALVSLRQLNPEFLLGGAMRIEGELSDKAIADKIAKPLGMTGEDAALGILHVVVQNIVASMRMITIERGYHPADFSLVAFGGMGPTLATAVAAALGVREVIVPPVPGNFSAYGMLLSDLRFDLAKTRLIPLTDEGLKAAVAGLLDLEAAARNELCEQGAEKNRIEVSWLFDMRYRGQAYELPVAVPGNPTSLKVDEIEAKFGALHERRYGHRAEDAAVEIVSLRVRAQFPLGKADLPRTQAGSRLRSATSYRKVRFSSGVVEAPVLQRDDITVGFQSEEPMIIEEQTSTVVVEPGWKVRSDREGNLILAEQLKIN
jgi:N-methylhydantoinase A